MMLVFATEKSSNDSDMLFPLIIGGIAGIVFVGSGYMLYTANENNAVLESDVMLAIEDGKMKGKSSKNSLPQIEAPDRTTNEDWALTSCSPEASPTKHRDPSLPSSSGVQP